MYILRTHMSTPTLHVLYVHQLRYTHSHACTHTHQHNTLTLTRMHTHTHSHSPAHAHTHSLTLSRSCTHTLTHTLPPAHTHTHTHTRTHTNITHSLTLSLPSHITQDLHQFFPHLLSNIFGFDRSGGWGLRAFSYTLHSDFPTLLQFLSPGGDLFHLIARLDGEAFLYEFPIHCLPVSVHITMYMYVATVHVLRLVQRLTHVQ